MYNFITGKYLTCRHPVVWNSQTTLSGELSESWNHGSQLYPSRPFDGSELLVKSCVPALPCRVPGKCPRQSQVSALGRGLFHILGQLQGCVKQGDPGTETMIAKSIQPLCDRRLATHGLPTQWAKLVPRKEGKTGSLQSTRIFQNHRPHKAIDPFCRPLLWQLSHP